MPIQWFPEHLTFEHYRKAFSTVPFALFFWNSLVLAVSGVLANLFFGSLSGYAFAKLRFKLNKPVFRVLLAAMMIPGIVTMIPTVYVMRHIPFAGGNDLWRGRQWADELLLGHYSSRCFRELRCILYAAIFLTLPH